MLLNVARRMLIIYLNKHKIKKDFKRLFFSLKTHAQLVYKLVKIDCQGNPKRVNNISCHVKAINWNLAVVNMDCVLIVPLRKPVVRLCFDPYSDL